MDVDQDDDEITFWPHKDGQVNELASWLAVNYLDRDRIKIYIEQLPTKDTPSATINNGADDSIVTNDVSVILLSTYY